MERENFYFSLLEIIIIIKKNVPVYDIMYLNRINYLIYIK